MDNVLSIVIEFFRGKVTNQQHATGTTMSEETDTITNIETPKKEGTKWEKARRTLLFLFGIVLPTITLGVELIWGACTDLFFDPIPTAGHALLVAVVPISNGMIWVRS